tara:strand:+ start:632 stop:1129 length:498 start_codon:yes stop_codon:yes gene_type:complete
MASILKTDKIEGVTASGTVQMPEGSVIQVVQGTLYGTVNFTATSMTASGLSVNITPKFSTSKMLVTCTFVSDLSAGGRQMYATLYRDSTRLDTQTALGGNASSNGLHTNYSTARIIFDGSMQFLDLPSTSSTITYEAYAKSVTGGIVSFNAQNCLGRIIVEEIAQ